MKLKIISDGTPMGTKVVDEEGRGLNGVRSVAWNVDVNSVSCCTLDLIGVPVEVESEKVEISSVEFFSMQQDFPLSEEEANRLEETLLSLKAQQFESVKEIIERVKMRKLVHAVTKRN